MSSKLIIDGNAVYEIDEECLNKDISKTDNKDFPEVKQKSSFPNIKKGMK